MPFSVRPLIDGAGNHQVLQQGVLSYKQVVADDCRRRDPEESC